MFGQNKLGKIEIDQVRAYQLKKPIKARISTLFHSSSSGGRRRWRSNGCYERDRKREGRGWRRRADKATELGDSGRGGDESEDGQRGEDAIGDGGGKEGAGKDSGGAPANRGGGGVGRADGEAVVGRNVCRFVCESV